MELGGHWSHFSVFATLARGGHQCTSHKSYKSVAQASDTLLSDTLTSHYTSIFISFNSRTHMHVGLGNYHSAADTYLPNDSKTNDCSVS